ncbi:MAG: hypothetical protein M1835_008148 [Candelina submexicana]|nr:MAG: hypothetical protein M1835_008148 [Candelina submexicana]
MVSRKRGRHELEELETSESVSEPSMLNRIRNMWEFANLMQYIFIFGRAVKIDEDLDIEDLEKECLKSGHSDKLAELGLALLKFVSSHRGLTQSNSPEIFDEYTRRQYKAKAPSRNPFGEEEVPNRFADFDVFTKIRVLYQLSQWTLINSERIRERMPETKDTEQTQWRIEEVGYDRQERLYFVLDDNRLYRRTDPPLPPPPAPKPKANSKKGKAAARASKRRKVSGITSDNAADGVEGDIADSAQPHEVEDGLGGRKWECLAITLSQYKDFIETLRNTKDPDEKYLYKTLVDNVLPTIEKLEEAQQRKAARREREMLNLEKLATAKRSSRIASKLDKQKEEQEAAEAERRRHAELVDAWKDRERQKKMEEARESRMMTREQRLKEREYKRILHEEELANLSEDSKKLETGEARISERHLKAEMEKRKRELEKLTQEDEWVFDCSVCGVHGDNLDDGSHSIACGKCNVWQHSACLGVSQEAAERDDFHFLCTDCKRRIEDAKRPKIPSLKFRLGPSSSPPTNPALQHNDGAASRKRKHEIDSTSPSKKTKGPQNGSFGTAAYHSSQDSVGSNPKPTVNVMNGPDLSPSGYKNHTNGNSHSPRSIDPTMSNVQVQIPYKPPTSGQYQQIINEGLPHASPGVGVQSGGPPQQTQSTPHQPFLNSFDRQSPSSSHSTKPVPSPTKSHSTPSPTQISSDIGPLTFPAAGSLNGLPQPQGPPPSVSPAKSSPSPTVVHQSNPPILPPSSTGLSPAKQTPARTTTYQTSHENAVIPPVTLSPSPRQQNLSPSTKVLTFMQTQVNGQ